MSNTLPCLPPVNADLVAEIPQMRPEPLPAPPADPAWLVVSRGPDTGAAFMITAATTTIGRHKECDIVLEDMTVSRMHAELQRRDHGFVLVDGGSLNGTYVNRRPAGSVRLQDGDQIWIGKARFTFHTAAVGTTTAQRVPQQQSVRS